MLAADLFRAVYENPADDGARQVLADVLIEAGDPRGEFIALQMQPRRSRKVELKLARLLERHRLAFLGPLAPVSLAAGEVWEKGFLVEGKLHLDGSLTAEPSLATLRSIELLIREDQVPLELLGPNVRSLREVRGLPRQAVLPIVGAARPLPFTLVAVDGPGNAEAWAPAELEALRQASALPALRSLSVSVTQFTVDGLEWLWTAPVFSRVRTMELRLHRVAVNLSVLRDRLATIDDPPDTLVLHGRQFELKLKPQDGWRVMHLVVRTPRFDAVVSDIEVMMMSLPKNGLLRFDITSEHPIATDALARLKAIVKRFPRLAPVTWPSSSR